MFIFPKILESNLLDGGAPFYRCYETSDGKYIAVGALEDKFYQNFLKAINFKDAEERFSQFDIENWPEFEKRIAKIIQTKTRDEWSKIFETIDACVTPVLEMDEAPKFALHRDREAFSQSTGLPSPAPKLSRTPAERGPQSTQGPITKAVLEQLGYSDDQILKLSGDGVIDDPESDEDV